LITNIYFRWKFSHFNSFVLQKFPSDLTNRWSTHLTYRVSNFTPSPNHDHTDYYREVPVVSLVEDLNLWMPFIVMYSIHVLIGLFRTNQMVFLRMSLDEQCNKIGSRGAYSFETFIANVQRSAVWSTTLTSFGLIVYSLMLYINP
jgi:hypothetical protein